MCLEVGQIIFVERDAMQIGPVGGRRDSSRKPRKNNVEGWEALERRLPTRERRTRAGVPCSNTYNWQRRMKEAAEAQGRGRIWTLCMRIMRREMHEGDPGTN